MASPESHQSRTSLSSFPGLAPATPSWRPIPASACPPSTLSSLGRVVRNCFLSSQALFVCSVAASSHPSTPEALTSSVGLLGPSPQPAIRCWASPPQTHHLEPRNPARPWRHPPLSTFPPAPATPSRWPCPQLGEKLKNQ